VAYTIGGLVAAGYIAGLLTYGLKSRKDPKVFVEEKQIQITKKNTN
jgi:hypothetical protein